MTQRKLVEASLGKVPSYYREEVWNKLAWLYDALVKLVLLPFGGEKRVRSKFLEFANLARGQQVLDICSGTGSLTALIADRVGTDGTVTGIDLSSTMLKIAERRANLPRVSFQHANSESLPFSDNTFDSSFASFGLHEMPESARINTLKEAYRVLKPGGNFFILDYNLPQNTCARFIIKTFVSLLEENFAYKMLLDESLRAEIRKAGFTLERQEFVCGGMLQMIQSTKVTEEDTNG